MNNLPRKTGEPYSKLRSQDRVPLKPQLSSRSEPVLEEDRRLVNWKRWLRDRQHRQQHLVGALKRRPLDLALNAHERVRTRNEARCLVEAAARPEVTNQDRYRGNPAFWKVADTLGSKNDADDEGEDVHVKMDRVTRNLPPKVTRVGLPDLIRKEKMLIESLLDKTKINLNSKWECGDYLQKRTTELKKDLKFLEPKKPEMENLIVVGRKFQCGDQEPILRTPVITITLNDTKKKLLNDPDDRIALKIQDSEFVLEKGHHFEKLSREQTKKLQESKEDLDQKKYAYSVFETDHVFKIFPKKVEPITWSLKFQARRSELCERKINLENRGIQVIHVDWRKETPVSLPIPIPTNFASCFFFNKNRISILPGQKVEIPIWFHSERPIVATETWKLLIEPRVYPGTLRLRLWATSSGEKLKLREKDDGVVIKSHLRRRVRNSTIREIIEDVFLASTSETTVDDMPYEMYFLEGDVFQARNPRYFYHFVLVDELKKMYKDSVIDANDDKDSTAEKEDWNLCLADLRSILLKIEDSNARLSKLTRFRQICDECLRPSLTYTRPVCPKERMVYSLLSAFFNAFEDERDFVLNRCCSQVVPEEEDEEEEEIKEQSEIFVTGRNLLVYREVLYVRIYCLLCDTVNRICDAVNSHDYLNKEGN